MEIGRLCVKIAGRDAGKRCVVVEVIDPNYVLIDGETRRRKCNLKHLEPLNQTVELKKGADHEAVKKALKTLSIEVLQTKPKKKTEKPKKQRKAKAEAQKETEESKEKPAPAQEKKAEPEKKAPPTEIKPTQKPEPSKKTEPATKETRPKKKPQPKKQKQ